MFWFFVLAAAIFVGYAVVTFWKTTPPGETKAHRMWLSLTAAATAIAAMVSSWFGTTPPPATP